MSSLTNKSTTLTDFLGEKKANDLMDKLTADQNSDRQVEVLNDFFSEYKAGPIKLFSMLAAARVYLEATAWNFWPDHRE